MNSGPGRIKPAIEATLAAMPDNIARPLRPRYGAVDDLIGKVHRVSVLPRDPEASIRVALRDVQCPRCNGNGRPRIVALAQRPSI